MGDRRHDRVLGVTVARALLWPTLAMVIAAIAGCGGGDRGNIKTPGVQRNTAPVAPTPAPTVAATPSAGPPPPQQGRGVPRRGAPLRPRPVRAAPRLFSLPAGGGEPPPP